MFLMRFVRVDHLDRIFSISNRSDFLKYDFVFNLAAETRYGQHEQVYASRCSDLSFLCAVKSSECGVRRFIEVINLIIP